MSSLNSALSALRVSQRALQTIGNNIANASTPGYHRQRIELADRRPVILGGLSIGQGVDVSRIQRLRNDALERTLLRTTSDTGRLSASLETLRQVESLFTPGTGTLHASLQDFFNQWELLAAQPQEGVRRQEVLQSAVAVADGINSLSGSLTQLKFGLKEEIDAAVDEVNRLSESAAGLNREIQLAEARGVTPNDLYDQRDRVVTQLAELIGADLIDAGATQGIRLAGGESVITTRAQSLRTAVGPNGYIELLVGEGTEPVSLSDGRLAGLIEGYNGIVPDFESHLDHLTTNFVAAVNTIHASGLGATGDLTIIGSTRSILPTNVPLKDAETDFPIEAGELSIGLTNTTTGERTLHRVPIDPSVDSLEDLASALDGLDGLAAQVDTQSGRLAISAESGWTFDLTGGLPSHAAVDTATGTSLPEVSGQYLGDVNDEWTLTVTGSGTVGQDDDIAIEVRDSAGSLLATLPVGQGYAPGDVLAVAEGVSLRVPVGTLNDGDTFRLPVIADPDTSGALAALGVNDLFTGTRPGTLGVNRALLEDSSRLSVSQSGGAGDGRIATRLAALSEQTGLNGNTSFSEYLARASGDAGVFVSHAEDDLAAMTQLSEQLTAERESVSGVNPDEELVHMLEFQRMFQTAARFLSSVNETLDEVLGLVR
ncbi:MAG: flagellar hook-associated protein FlgK [Planctomycetaceae bacterium]|nr:flagellar hook-associated protein FlgK [Planctomycetaceae bacterium]